MEKTCDRNQNVCDNISNINSDSEKTPCDEKQEDPSILVQKLSAILPSNFLNLSPRFVYSKIARRKDYNYCCQMAGLVHARTVRSSPHDFFLLPGQPRSYRPLRSHLDCSGKKKDFFSFLFDIFISSFPLTTK